MNRSIRSLCLILIALVFHLGVRADDNAAEVGRLANRLKNEGRYAEADKVYREAVSNASFSSGDRIKLRINWCELYLRRGMYDTANEMLDGMDCRGVPSWSPAKSSDAWNRCKASTLIYLNKYKEALDIYDRLLKNLERRTARGLPLKEEDSLMLREMVYSKGYLMAEMGQRDSAISYMRKAIAMETDERKRNIILSNLAVQEARVGQISNAIRDIDLSLVYFKSTLGTIGRPQGYAPTTFNPEYIITQRKKAEILLMAGLRAEATKVFADYVEGERRQAVKEFALFTEQRRLDYWKNKRPLISEIFQTEEEQPATLFDVSIFRREVALLGGADSIDIPRRLSLRGKDIRRSLKKGEIAVDFIKYAKDSVNRYAALIAYPMNDDRAVQFVPLWTEDSINNYMIGYTTLKDAVCSRLVSDKNAIYEDSVLAQFVWGQLTPLIKGATDVYFCPDGLLNMLAIEYLPIADNKPRLHRLTSFSKLTKRGKRKNTNSRMLAVGGLDYNEESEVNDESVGNHDAIDYLHKKVGKGQLFSYLSGTKDEVAAIDSFARQGIAIDTAYIKTEAEIKKDLSAGKYSALHLSTHGYSLMVDVDEQSEMFRDSLSEDRSLIASGIALSGANVAYRTEGGEDGVLSAREMCDMNLKQVDMVVLSACQTALGVVSDEGPAGIVRGLKKSGANTIIATLWEVDDMATKLLMSYFYGILSSRPDISKSEALNEAQDSLRNYKVVAHGVFNPATLSSRVEYMEYKSEGTPITPYKAPYYWAPFIVIDDYIEK